MLSSRCVIVMTVPALLIILLSWALTHFSLLQAGLDRPRTTDNRELLLRKLAGLTSLRREFEAFKSELLQPFLVVRDVFSPGHTAVKEHIKRELSELAWQVHEDSFTAEHTPMGAVNFTNVVATSDSEAQQFLVLACHYDSKYVSEFSFIGATDSAVPCAIMLHLAHCLHQFINRHPKSEIGLKLFFFDGEEALVQWNKRDSIYGSRHLAQEMEKTLVKVSVDKTITQLQQINLLVLLDLLGAEGMGFKNIQRPTTKHFQQLADIERSLQSHSLLSTTSRVYFDSTFHNYRIEDDHIPFLERGVPVVHLISVPFPKEWHKQEDDEDCLQYEAIHDVIKVLRVFVVDYLHLNVD